MLSALLLGISLAMDACAVTIVNGIKYADYKRNMVIFSALTFGLFQGLMPLIGYWIAQPFWQYIESFDHWVVFAILTILGMRMIKEAFAPEAFKTEDKFTLGILLAEAIATSIDALSVGISLPLLKIDPYLACLIIAIITALLCLLAASLGQKIGFYLKDKAVLCGGIILILIGIKTLWEHLL